MGVATLVVTGLNLDVDQFLKRSPFRPNSIFRKGEIPIKASPPQPRPDSGFTVPVSMDGEPTIDRQIKEVELFLATFEQEIRRAQAMGADIIMLDFGIPLQGILQQVEYLPAKLVGILGKLGIAIVISMVQLPKG